MSRFHSKFICINRKPSSHRKHRAFVLRCVFVCPLQKLKRRFSIYSDHAVNVLKHLLFFSRVCWRTRSLHVLPFDIFVLSLPQRAKCDESVSVGCYGTYQQSIDWRKFKYHLAISFILFWLEIRCFIVRCTDSETCCRTNARFHIRPRVFI